MDSSRTGCVGPRETEPYSGQLLGGPEEDWVIKGLRQKWD